LEIEHTDEIDKVLLFGELRFKPILSVSAAFQISVDSINGLFGHLL
jgi:hypothetical protein